MIVSCKSWSDISLYSFENWIALLNRTSEIKGKKISISKTTKDDLSIFWILINHLINSIPLIYWFLVDLLLISLLISHWSFVDLSGVTLLTLPILSFQELIKWQEILFGKSSLESLLVMYTSISSILCTLSEIDNFFVISF